MNDRIKYVLEGAASCAEIYPSDMVTIQDRDIKHRIYMAWLRVGEAINRAVEQAECEQRQVSK